VFAALRNRRGQPGGLVALRDTTGDGVADVTASFGENGGTGLELVGDTLLYFATDDAVLRYAVPRPGLTPTGPPDTIVSGLPSGRSHSAKSIVVRGGELLVNHGSPSNSCQVEDRQPRSPGQDPCLELETRAGVWRFDATRTGQGFRDGSRFATGTRNLVAMDLGAGDVLYAVQHGRDQLAANWGYSSEASAEKPAEEMFRIAEGDDFGWPYCHYDGQLQRKVLAPEYGGDGQEVGRCADKQDPILAFPAHWAPNALLFYTAEQFPPRYRGGAFVAFHGSWNRAPLPQGGYNVVFAPFRGGAPAGDWEVFADGFAGAQVQPSEAAHRPSGLVQGPDGSLYVSDDQGGRIWRIVHRSPGG
ncbi:MAG TPA: PQQ-dependent sugar dehydrogenase, partial [Longimicrobiales bacterium]|nr:PQQ-dependent sugar dehydrogenase [Longimicrobiales bacterium]